MPANSNVSGNSNVMTKQGWNMDMFGPAGSHLNNLPSAFSGLSPTTSFSYAVQAADLIGVRGGQEGPADNASSGSRGSSGSKRGLVHDPSRHDPTGVFGGGSESRELIRARDFSRVLGFWVLGWFLGLVFIFTQNPKP